MHATPFPPPTITTNARARSTSVDFAVTRCPNPRYFGVVSAAYQAHLSTVSIQAESAADLSRLGPSLDMLSQTENELSLPFTHMASGLDALRESLVKQVQSEHVSGLSALLAFNSGMAASLKDALKARDHAQTQMNRAAAALDARSNEMQKWKNAQAQMESSVAVHATPDTEWFIDRGKSWIKKLSDGNPSKGPKLKSQVEEAEKAFQAARSTWNTINRSLSDEAKSFHAATNADFSLGLKGHIDQQLTFEAARERRWRDILMVFESE